MKKALFILLAITVLTTSAEEIQPAQPSIREKALTLAKDHWQWGTAAVGAAVATVGASVDPILDFLSGRPRKKFGQKIIPILHRRAQPIVGNAYEDPLVLLSTLLQPYWELPKRDETENFEIKNTRGYHFKIISNTIPVSEIEQLIPTAFANENADRFKGENYSNRIAKLYWHYTYEYVLKHENRYSDWKRSFNRYRLPLIIAGASIAALSVAYGIYKLAED